MRCIVQVRSLHPPISVAGSCFRRSLQKIASEAVGGRFADSRRVISLKTEGPFQKMWRRALYTAVTN
eukprot:scaffold62910_cov45-Phaeocystis_antarctica.AAC.1